MKARRLFLAAAMALVPGACNASVVFDDEPPAGSGGSAQGEPDAGLCRQASDCPSGNACDATGHCIETCLSGLPCPAETPICDPRGVCVRCTTNLDCKVPGAAICDRANGQCVGCSLNSQCNHERPRCNATTGICGPCTSNGDCPPDHSFCRLPDGACEDDT